MRLCNAFFSIRDDSTRILRWSYSNRRITILFAAVQIVIISASCAQHAYSMSLGYGIFDCRFNNTVNYSHFLSVDVIVFDYGLFNQLLGTDKCVANHLDGGYIRFVWCLVQLGTLVLLQSIYSLGLIILALATLPKMLTAMIERFNEIAVNTLIYFAGTLFNWLFTVIIWHFYWHVKAQAKLPQIRYVEVSG
uniref:G-protein coupled receptors family 1 profile domain-containing protein n=1 Tax=Trichuris muris TaxID=70415 RepID=A0A5S6QXG2_TRIMR